MSEASPTPSDLTSHLPPELKREFDEVILEETITRCFMEHPTAASRADFGDGYRAGFRAGAAQAIEEAANAIGGLLDVGPIGPRERGICDAQDAVVALRLANPAAPVQVVPETLELDPWPWVYALLGPASGGFTPARSAIQETGGFVFDPQPGFSRDRTAYGLPTEGEGQ